jgi:hypothetical protein
VKQQMVVYVVSRVQGCEWQPGKIGKRASLNRLPKRAGPFDVVVTVEIAAADGVCGKLQLPEDDYDRDSAGYKLDDA